MKLRYNNIDKKSLMVTLEVLHNTYAEYPVTVQHIEENISDLCEREKLSVKVVFYFLAFE